MTFYRSYGDLRRSPVGREPILVARADGARVYQGDLRSLPTVLPSEIDLTALDLFEKMDADRVARIG